jgi:hypothetical protein
MTAKEFAIKYAGHEVCWTEAYTKNKTKKDEWHYSRVVGRVFGYFNNFVAYELCDDLAKILNVADDTYHRQWLSRHITYSTNERLKWLFADVSAFKEAIVNKPINPYPHKCKVCHRPARKCSGFILCSNVKCKSRRKIPVFKSFTEYNSKDNPISVLCPVCNRLAMNLFRNTNYVISSLSCRNCSRQPYTFKINMWYKWEHGVVQYGEDGWQYYKPNGE